MIESIWAGSIVTLKHFNLEGFYDFADDQVKDSFDLGDAIKINHNELLTAKNLAYGTVHPFMQAYPTSKK